MKYTWLFLILFGVVAYKFYILPASQSAATDADQTAETSITKQAPVIPVIESKQISKKETPVSMDDAVHSSDQSLNPALDSHPNPKDHHVTADDAVNSGSEMH